ncbi:MAG: SUMF1/EgtB/PvdO family nonheme iron enzyme [Bacteroidia bacterium]|nr:SUMF1/EgtB/PvdO family nonheme iron enzyme [Bacteroidia bacterium]
MSRWILGLLIGLTACDFTADPKVQDPRLPVALLRSGEESGTAFLIGYQQGQLYLLTAAHVIARPDSISLQFFGRQRSAARLLASDPEIDLAVLSCPAPEGPGEWASFLAAGTPPKINSEVTIVGHPAGNEWDVNRANRVKEAEYGLIPGRFTLYPIGIGPGSSGSPVLNADHELYGMVVEADQVKTVCLQGAVLLRACQTWRVPVNLLTGLREAEGQPSAEGPGTTGTADPQAGKMKLIPGGTFMMGSNEGGSDEKPPHSVTLQPFYLGVYEVTVEEFEAFVLASGYQTDAEKSGGSYLWIDKWELKAGVTWKHDAKGDLRPRSEYQHPVIHVSWNDAQAYCAWLSRQSGQRYRLPTEAEWEYAAGNGASHTRYSWGNGDPSGNKGGNVADETAKKSFSSWTIFNGYTDGYVYTAPVGQYDANTFGLHDMTGNVWEWCQDWYHSSYSGAPADGSAWESPTGSVRVIRGGGWRNGGPAYCRVAHRFFDAPGNRYSLLGFRLARTP